MTHHTDTLIAQVRSIDAAVAALEREVTRLSLETNQQQYLGRCFDLLRMELAALRVTSPITCSIGERAVTGWPDQSCYAMQASFESIHEVMESASSGFDEQARSGPASLRRSVTAAVTLLVSMLVGLPHGQNRWSLPQNAPRMSAPEFDRVIRLHIEYDDALLEQHGSALPEYVAQALAVLNVEWRRYRREWFTLGSLHHHSSAPARDASYTLASFLHRTTSQQDVIHVNVVGRALEVYSNGTGAIAIGGLAYRGSDAIVVSATRGVSPELLAYYLFHELGHCWDAFDIPFHGGNTTFGAKTQMTFEIDAGNEEIMEDSAGPMPRHTAGRAPAVLRRRLAFARSETAGTPYYPALHDLLLHEASPSNPEYVAKKTALLANAGAHRKRIQGVLSHFELTPQQVRDDQEVRHQIADLYWRANDAIRRRDYLAAEEQLLTIREIAGESPDVHLLVGAVEKKARRRR